MEFGVNPGQNFLNSFNYKAQKCIRNLTEVEIMFKLKWTVDIYNKGLCGSYSMVCKSQSNPMIWSYSCQCAVLLHE